jgi:4-hydroxybenzoate polyprenyltransferase
MDNSEAQMNRIRIGKRNAMWTFPGFFLATTVAVYLKYKYGISFAYILLPYIILSMIYFTYIGTLLCPRCKKYFFLKGITWGIFFTKNCMNCGLPLFQ